MDFVQSRQMSYTKIYSQDWNSPICCENFQTIGSWGLKKIICRALQSNYWKVEGGIELQNQISCAQFYIFYIFDINEIRWD